MRGTQGSPQLQPAREGGSGKRHRLWLPWFNPGRPPCHTGGRGRTGSVGGMRACGHQGPGKRPKTHTGPTGPESYSSAPAVGAAPRTSEQGTRSVLRGAQASPRLGGGGQSLLRGSPDGSGAESGEGQAGCKDPADPPGRSHSFPPDGALLPRPEPQPAPAPPGEECWAGSRGSAPLCPPPAGRRGPQPCSRLSLGCTTV